MPTFYFHVKTGDRLLVDEEGQVLHDLSAARNEALLSAREILASAIVEGDPSSPDSILVTDDTGSVIDTLHLIAVLPMNMTSRMREE
jgi:hypothetical protein